MSIDKLDQQALESVTKVATMAEVLPGVVIIHDMRDWSVVWMSQKGLKLLGISIEEVKSLSADEYYRRYFNPEDTRDYVPKIFELIERNNDEESVAYFQQVKFAKDPDWHWHMSSTRIFLRNEDKKPLLIITVSFPIDPEHHLSTKAERLLQENNFLRKNFDLYATLSLREREILQLLALGKSAVETAAELYISANTVETHRKKRKI